MLTACTFSQLGLCEHNANDVVSLVACLVGSFVGWFVGWLLGWLFGWLVVCFGFVCWLVGWFLFVGFAMEMNGSRRSSRPRVQVVPSEMNDGCLVTRPVAVCFVWLVCLLAVLFAVRGFGVVFGWVFGWLVCCLLLVGWLAGLFCGFVGWLVGLPV